MPLRHAEGGIGIARGRGCRPFGDLVKDLLLDALAEVIEVVLEQSDAFSRGGTVSVVPLVPSATPKRMRAAGPEPVVRHPDQDLLQQQIEGVESAVDVVGVDRSRDDVFVGVPGARRSFRRGRGAHAG